MKDKLPKEEIKKLLGKLEREGKDMVMEVLQKESERQRKIGERKGRLDMLKYSIQNMLKKNMEIGEIQEITGITNEELQRIQKILAKT